MRGISLLLCLAVLQAEACPEPSGREAATPPVCIRTPDMPEQLRMDHYRGPTPVCVPNAVTLDIPGLQALLAQSPSTVLIDVWAILLRQEEGFPSVWLPNEAHYSLPGAVWLPNVGYGELKPDLEAYLRSNLQRLTAGNKDHPLVFFCVADCWMSWNTVQRVRDYGYTQVYWFKNGTDGWQEAGLELVEVEPVPLADREE
ncbi:MAG: rhodanese-like domain-containing protein [Thiolinea sp.]